jgi:SCY1-like protein 1
VAPRLQESIRVRVIVPAFLKAMKDPFAYARLAAVRATCACKALYDPALVAAKLLPDLCPLLLDPYGPVRDAAADCLQQLLEPVKKQSEAMKAAEAAKKEKHEADEAARRAKEGPKVGEIAKAGPAAFGSSSSASPHLSSLPSFSAAAAELTSMLSPAKPPVGGMQLGGRATGGSAGKPKVATATKLLPDPPSGGLGFKTPSDSAFWDAIGDDDDGLIASQTVPGSAPNALAGWGDAWGDDDGLGALDDDEEATPAESLKPEPLATKRPTGAMKLGSGPAAAAEPLFGTSSGSPAKKSVAERRAEAQKAKEARLNAAKLPTSGGGGGGDGDWEW